MGLDQYVYGIKGKVTRESNGEWPSWYVDDAVEIYEFRSRRVLDRWFDELYWEKGGQCGNDYKEAI